MNQEFSRLMNKGRWIAVGALCGLILTGPMAVFAETSTSVARMQDAMTLTRKVKAGDSVRYKTTLTLSANGADVTVEQNRKQTVKEVKESGETVTEITGEGDKLTVNGETNDIPPTAATTVTLDKSGKILSYKPAAADDPYLSTSTLHLLTLAEEIIFPDKAVKTGDSWKTEVDNPAVKEKKVVITTTFVGIEKVDGADVWKVKQTLEAETAGGGSLKSEMTALVETTTGQTLSAEQSVTGVPTSELGALDWKAKLVRVKAEAAKPEVAKPAAP
jgi:hypothetical protein